MLISFFQFICNQLKKVPPFVSADLSGKTVLVVGANVGIGYETAKYLATLNPGKLILACRSLSRGEAALAKLKQETGCQTAELRLVDLTNFDSVNDFCEKFNEEIDRLDLIVENAGIVPLPDHPTTGDGWETTLQTNNLSLSLIAFLLLPKLLTTTERYKSIPRLVVVSSGVHYLAKLDVKLINEPNPLRVFGSMTYFDPSTQNLLAASQRYCDTKLLNVLFVRAFAAHLGRNPPVIVNAVNPGFCLSNLRSGASGFQAFCDRLMEKALARTTEEGARQLVWAALASENGKELDLSGAYISDMAVETPHKFVSSELGKRAQDKLWENLVDELAEVNPKVRDIVGRYLSVA